MTMISPKAIVLIFVVIFILNSINGQKLVKSLNQQFDLQMEYNSTPTSQNGNSNHPQNNTNTEEIAIIVTSSWMPSAPSTYIIDTVLNSTDRLVGLPPTTPIFVTIDFFSYKEFEKNPPDLLDRTKALEEYQANLFSTYLSNPRVYIIPAAKNLHIGGSIMKALNLIDRHFPAVRYVYYLQHDFPFLMNVDHSALVNVMDKYPDKINHIRFPKCDYYMNHDPNSVGKCGNEKPIQYDRAIPNLDGDPADGAKRETSTLTLYPTHSYSDNNHLARFHWYKKVIASLGFLERPPEFPLQGSANEACQRNESLGLYLYHESNIAHLDGREAATVESVQELARFQKNLCQKANANSQYYKNKV